MWQEKTDKKNRLDIKNMTMVGVFVVLIAVGAFIKFPIWFIPFSLQFIFTNLAGLILGKKYGALAVIIYAIVGLLGVPIFTAGGGIGYVFQPSFGYIIGMAVGAFVVGHYTENRRDLNSGTVKLAIEEYDHRESIEYDSNICNWIAVSCFNN